MTTRPAHRRPRLSDTGFTLIELMVVVAILAIVALLALPNSSRAVAGLRLRNDGRSLANTVSLAKMRAASGFTRARVQLVHGTGHYFMQIWRKPVGTTPGAWITEGGMQQLSFGVSVGYGSAGTPPPDTQTTIHQSPECTANDGTTAIANTSCITFNSRGIPVAGESPYGDNGLYLTDGTGIYGTTVTATPLIRRWWTPASAAHWVKQ